MSVEHVLVSATLAEYVETRSSVPDAVQQELITATAEVGDASIMQISPAQGTLMTILTSLLQPRFAVEIGTFTGYSALCVAKALPPDGRLLCCDISTEWTDIARKYWQRAGVADRIDLRVAPAIDTLRSLPEETQIDFAFIDADKESYIDYYEEIVSRLSPRGVILVDNVLWSGLVADPAHSDATTESLRSFNAQVADDERVTVSVLPVGDGLSVISRRVT